MPQLNPAPWFLIFIFAWFVLLTLIPPKVLAHLSPQELSTQNAKKLVTKPWNWPWQ